ncbi:hypothetical protein [Streptomyces sp. NBC_01363]|uniref:hypothetical protein n=1 Tax=Streptomyces sp. NBC_01363 TaxID=2903840 RepID=UPI00225C3EE8|nr:hypothetical protein [Streptomyces sp. NBC_01363]MCX4736823.1 hypothetical protein [Streptomyces sp. NBC_01363]
MWAPSRTEWERLAAHGEHGLVYTAASSDAYSPESVLQEDPQPRESDFEWIVPTLLAHAAGSQPPALHIANANAHGLTGSRAHGLTDKDICFLITGTAHRPSRIPPLTFERSLSQNRMVPCSITSRTR